MLFLLSIWVEEIKCIIFVCRETRTYMGEKSQSLTLKRQLLSLAISKIALKYY